MPGTPTPETAAQLSRRLIVAAVQAIPPGEVAGYGEVARRAGLPGRARLVAKLLSAGDVPGLPWHRVVRSDGRVALPAGSAGFDEQVRRLRAEGVRVEAGRVRGQRSAPTLDALLWAPPDAFGAPDVKRDGAAAGTRRRR